jgi:hypothetical protein
MKTVICALLAAALLGSCSSKFRESDEVGPEIRGTWSGEGRFLDRDLNEEYGRFPVRIEIHEDNSVTGTLGSATLTEAVVKSRPEDFLIDGELEGAVFAEGSLPGEKKDCVVFLLTPPAEAATAGNIHLKTNHTFDVKMRVCGVELSQTL